MTSSSSRLLPVLGAVGYVQTNTGEKRTGIAGEVVWLLSSSTRVDTGGIDTTLELVSIRRSLEH